MRGGPVRVAHATHRRARLGLTRREALTGYALIAPWVVGFVVWHLGPMLASLYLSLTDYSLLSAPKFAGLGMYERALFKDDLFWTSLSVTLWYAALYVPTSLAGSLACALVLNQNLRWRGAYRTLFFLPSVVPAVAGTLVWMTLLNPELGLVNYLLRGAGIASPPAWLSSPDWALSALVLIGLWGIGGPGAVIFLAGLQGIPSHLYEAAAIDGAGAWDRLRHVTLPMLSPTIFLMAVVGLIAAFESFTVAFVASNGQGGPIHATLFYSLYLYQNAFAYLRMGYASALAWLLFVVLVGFTYYQFRIARRWVHYESGGDE
jgi:multiple sugar transport system permease protein